MNEKNQEYLSNAEIAFISEQYETALELCEKAIAEDPSNADAYSSAGKICLVIDRLSESEQYYQKAAELDSANGERYFDLGNIKFGVEKYPEALANYAKAAQLGCDDKILRKLYYQMGILSHMTGNTKSALINYAKADSLGVVNEDTKEMLLKRLQIYIESEDFASAENYAVQLKMLAPNEFRSYQIYFQVLIAVGKYDQADEVLADAEKYSDIESDILNKADMCFNKAMIFAVKAENDFENAATHYQSALAIFDEFLTTPDLPQEVIANIAFSKAEMFLKMEKFDETLQCVNSIPKSDNSAMEDESVGSDLAENDEISAEDETYEKIDFIKLSCYLGKEDYEKSVDIAAKLKESNNEQYKYFAVYADAFITKKLADKDAGQKETAEETYNNAIAFFKNKAFENPMDMFAMMFRIRLYAENGKYAMAEDMIKLLPDVLKPDLNKYVSDCRAELIKG